MPRCAAWRDGIRETVGEERLTRAGEVGVLRLMLKSFEEHTDRTRHL